MLRRLLLLCTILLSVGLTGGVALWAAPVADGVESGVVRVKLQRELGDRISLNPVLPMSAEGVVTTGVTLFDRASQKVRAVSMKRVFPHSVKNEAKHRKYGLDLWYEIRYEASSVQPAQARDLYKAVPGVQKAETVRAAQLVGDGPYQTFSTATVARAMQEAATFPFNDPLLPQQWHYHNDGSMTGSKAGADANVWAAWAEETGKSDVVVAIIDGGFQVDHPDLAPNTWVNEAELGGQPGVDDDGNGYVDDVYGYNFVTGSADINAHSHGTHVAGTVGAVNGNGIGVAGVAGGLDGQGGVKMMSCQVFDSRTSAAGNYAAALVYAADMGASIAQCSWGYSEPGYYEEVVNEAVRYFTEEAWTDRMNGGLCIFANGNTGIEGDFYPACLPEAVAVGALASDGKVAYYSSRGTWCDVTAPGGLMDNGEKYGVLSTLPNSTYGYNEGTSMACPHVSGIAALVLSKYGNSQFSNETLRTQLTSSVNDLYTDNPDMVGLFGSGYIDAYKALQMGTGAAPAAVDGFTLTPSQDNVLVEWVIPAADEGSVDHHLIYYSTEPFTSADDLSKVRCVSVDTKFKNSGDAMSYEIGGLKPLTTYYIALVAYNRWGQGAALSPVKETTTNAGPEVQLSASTLSMTVDAQNSPVATSQFTISNVGEGMLKYQLTAATRSVSVATSAVEKQPAPGHVVPANAHLVVAKAANHPLVTADYQATDYPKQLTYASSIWAYLGDEDKTKPNALAQYFYVDPDTYPEGFNLTALKFGGMNGTNPDIEIYDGSKTISAASLLAKVNYSFWAYNYDINLTEQLYFPAGASFWVVAKFPVGQTNPLGAGKTEQTGLRNYSFFSNDNGATWQQLAEAVKGGIYENVADQLVWDVTAISKNPDWSAVLKPEPIEGTVRAGESQDVQLTNDGQSLVNGTYRFNLKVKSNESEAADHVVAVNMTVKNNVPALSSASLVNFGELLVGETKTLSVELVNSGYGVFGGNYGSLGSSNIKCSSDQFQVPTYMPAIAARGKSTIDVTFKPTRAGSLSGTVTLTSKAGIKHTFTVRGVAVDPAKIEVDKDTIDVGSLTVGGETKTASFTISNAGQYPLEFVMPKYSAKTLAGASGHKFGYTYISNLNGSDAFAYDGNRELVSETDITSQFSDHQWLSEPVSLGFKFPFYGQDYEQVYISSHGGVSMYTADGNIACLVPTANCVNGLGYISAYANSGHLDLNTNSKITYGRQDGKFVVKFKNVITPALRGGDEKTIISFHMALCPDGSVEVYYDDYDPTTVFGEGGYLMCAVSDPDCADEFVVTDWDAVCDYDNYIYSQFQTGTAVKILAPATSIIESVSPADGVIGIGDSQEVTVTVKAGDKVYAGAIENLLTVATNDPQTPTKNIVVKANIEGDLRPLAVVDAETISFGRHFRTSTPRRAVLLSNKGRSPLTVESVAVTDGKFRLDASLQVPFVVEPGQGRDIDVYLPTELEGAVTDQLVLTFQGHEPIHVQLEGEVIGVPQWALAPEAIEETVNHGATISKELVIKNDGNEPLTFSLYPEAWYGRNDVTVDETSSVDYSFKAKSDGQGVDYKWEDITETADAHLPMSYFLDQTDYYTVDLPFEFPFYGVNYKKMYIYNTGFVSFTDIGADYKNFPEPPAGLPTTDTFYKNIIAPFWGNHTMDVSSTDGVFYKAEDDRVIVSFKNYGNSAMIGMNYQLIMYKDGRFKFQYNLNETGMVLGIYGLCGFQDESCQRGLTLSDSYIVSGNAIEFAPVKTINVPAGGQVSVPIDIYANDLAGEYDRAITIHTNVPGKEIVTLPVKLVINGQPNPVFPQPFEIEEVADYLNYPTLEYEFEVKNTGSAAFTIDAISFNPEPDYNDPDFDWENYQPIPAYLTVYTTYYDSWWDEWVTDWSNVNYLTEPIVVGTEPVKFKLLFMDQGMPTEASLPITFHVSGLATDQIVVPFHIVLTDAPVMTLDRETIAITNVKPDYEGEETLTIGNEGAYKLKYSLRLDPSGRDEVPVVDEEGGGGVAPAANTFSPLAPDSIGAQLHARGGSAISLFNFSDGQGDQDAYIYDVPKGTEYSNLIYYPVLQPVSSAKSAILGTGSTLTDNFYAATRFVAPDQGFNLSHLYFVGTIGDLENVDIEATVIYGSDVTKGRQIGHGKLRVEKEEPRDGGYYGEPRMLAFDSPVFINPADTFYVVVKYPAGYGHSAMLVNKDGSKSPNRYMAYLNSFGGWFDVEEMLDANYGYGAMGFFMTCVEREAGEPWIRLLDAQTEGELAPGEQLPVKFAVKAANTYFDKDNKATLVIHTNDPSQKLVNYHITLDRNAAPLITVPASTLTVAEGDVAILRTVVTDAEGDAFTLSFSDDCEAATILAATSADGSTEGVEIADDGSVRVAAGYSLTLDLQLAPAYGQAGAHTVAFTATDETGSVSTAQAHYQVEHTNRAPVYEGVEEIVLAPGQVTPIYLFTSFFSDPDGDDMTYTATVADAGVAAAYTSLGGFIIATMGEGSTTLTLTATDVNGATTTQQVPIIVSTSAGIETAPASPSAVTVTAEALKAIVTLPTAHHVVLTVYDAAGRAVVVKEMNETAAGQHALLSLSTAGVYQLAAEIDGVTTVVKFVAK